MGKKVFKKHNILSKLGKHIFSLLLVFCALFPLFTACTPTTNSEKDYVTVTVVEDEAFRFTQKQYRVKRGQDITVKLNYKSGYSFLSCNYDDYTFVEEENAVTKINLNDVIYSFRLNVTSSYSVLDDETVTTDYRIRYYFNGGEYTANPSLEESVDIRYGLLNHLRANTLACSDVLLRDGYILTGWNTQADGEGEHIGLGSRVTVEDGILVTLYAEWTACMSADDFTYTEIEAGEGVALTSYLGETSVEQLVLPRVINGQEVTEIAQNFASDITATRIVLPDTVETVDSYAFTNCSFAEILFFDGIWFKDRAFCDFQIKTWYVNAQIAPRFQGSDDLNGEAAGYADKIDKLMLCDKKKMLIFGGCSLSYGLNSRLIADVYGDEYEIMNMGVCGATDVGIQLEGIIQYVDEGDLFIHCPEVPSEYHLLSKREFAIRNFVMVEGNYDLLRFMDMSVVGDAFNTFRGYNLTRSSFGDDGTYDETTGLYDAYGDITTERPGGAGDRSLTSLAGFYTYDSSIITAQNVSNICAVYANLEAKGVEIYLSYGPINYHGMPEEDRQQSKIDEYDALYKTAYAAQGYTVISNLSNYIFYGRYFYDEDYHLNDEGAVLRTQQLLEDLRSVLP